MRLLRSLTPVLVIALVASFGAGPATPAASAAQCGPKVLNAFAYGAAQHGADVQVSYSKKWSITKVTGDGKRLKKIGKGKVPKSAPRSWGPAGTPYAVYRAPKHHAGDTITLRVSYFGGFFCAGTRRIVVTIGQGG